MMMAVMMVMVMMMLVMQLSAVMTDVIDSNLFEQTARYLFIELVFSVLGFYGHAEYVGSNPAKK